MLELVRTKLIFISEREVAEEVVVVVVVAVVAMVVMGC